MRTAGSRDWCCATISSFWPRLSLLFDLHAILCCSRCSMLQLQVGPKASKRVRRKGRHSSSTHSRVQRRRMVKIRSLMVKRRSRMLPGQAPAHLYVHLTCGSGVCRPSWSSPLSPALPVRPSHHLPQVLVRSSNSYPRASCARRLRQSSRSRLDRAGRRPRRARTHLAGMMHRWLAVRPELSPCPGRRSLRRRTTFPLIQRCSARRAAGA